MPQLLNQMKNRLEIFSKNRFIICSSCNIMRASGEFYVMFKLGNAYEELFYNEITKDNHWATCDECCGNRFVDRVQKYIDN